jgi:serine/threonine protein phosphatase PrpC/pSer/pThr/pTyr-binding forkhead associated (FHA) protein
MASKSGTGRLDCKDIDVKDDVDVKDDAGAAGAGVVMDGTSPSYSKAGDTPWDGLSPERVAVRCCSSCQYNPRTPLPLPNDSPASPSTLPPALCPLLLSTLPCPLLPAPSTGTTSEETLSRGNPLAEFLRNQKGNFKDMKEEEFLAKYEAYAREKGLEEAHPDSKQACAVLPSHSAADSKDEEPVAAGAAGAEGGFKNVVLKFTTLSEGCMEAPSFTVGRSGAKIGRDPNNDIVVPSDQRLAPEGHASIEYHRGAFYLHDGGFSFSASVRIGLNHGHTKRWHMDRDVRFSAGNSVIESRGVNADGELELLVIEGPLKATTLVVDKSGATFGRSSENKVCIPDKELSRKHTRIDFDSKSGRYSVNDMGSTNGTYVQLVGPYGGRYKLNLNDHILVGRTGFSINRYDYGLSEEMGYRQSMEDACTIVQHLNIGPLCSQDLTPQSFFGVFDGHGGALASHYLAQHLHVNVAHGLLDEAAGIFQSLGTVPPASLYDQPSSSLPFAALDRIVCQTLKATFLKTDQDFLSSSAHPQHGSTATTALILGRRIYCATVGDSRSMLCRTFAPLVMSDDHKPTRPDESKRIRDAGGFVINNRVMGELAVSRAFGDVDFKKGIQSIIEEEGGGLPPVHRTETEGEEGGGEASNWDQPLIIAEPEIKTATISEQDQFLLLACDGLFDVYSPEDVVAFVKAGMEKHGDAQRCCQALTHDAIRKRNSRDNVSVILIILNKWY